MKPIVTFCLILIVFQAKSSVHDTVPEYQNKLFDNSWLNISICPISSSNSLLGAFRIETSVMSTVKSKSKMGLKLTYSHQNEYCEVFSDDEDNILHGFGIGIVYKYHFLSQPSSPFISFDCLLDTWNQNNEVVNNGNFNTRWDWGSSYYLNFGYSFSAPKKSLGFETSYSIGMQYSNNNVYYNYRSSNTYSYKTYFFKFLNFIRIGVNYYF